MSLVTYKLIHVFGLLLMFTALGGLTTLVMTGQDQGKHRKLAGMLHGIALLIILLGGFGALAKLGIGGGFPAWAWVKILLWLIFGGMTVFIRKAPQMAKLFLVLLPILGTVGGYVALFKP